MQRTIPRMMQKTIPRTTRRKRPLAFTLLTTFLRLVTVVVTAIGALFLISIGVARAMQQPEVRDRIRTFNKRTLNPLALKIAGNASGVYASLQHTGRRSGKTYMTPVVARPLGEDFAIPLPYGTDVDWCRNIMAAKTCKLTWKNQEYTLEKPEIVTADTALSAFPWSQKFIFELGGITHYLLLHRQPVAAPKVLKEA